MKKSLLAQMIGAAFMMSAGAASAQFTDDSVRIGVLTDMSGIYSAVEGPGALLAAQMAVEDFGGKVLGKEIIITSADTQSKADLSGSKAREMIDRDKVDVLMGNVSTASALAAMEVADQRKKIAIVTGAASLPITNERCNPYTIHYVYDTYALAHGTASAVVAGGKKSWFFVTADYAFGHTLQRDASSVIESNGGKVLGSVAHPINTTDFASYLAQAQSSGAEVIALANAGGDTIGSVKQAAELGIMGSKQTVVPLLMFISDIRALGLRETQGMNFTVGWYWDFSQANRDFSKRFMARFKDVAPTSVQAGVYSSTMNYLKAVQATKTDDSDKVMAYLKATPIDDGLFKGVIRADGKFQHDMYLLQVKSPKESKSRNDVASVARVIPAAEGSLPLADSKCYLVTGKKPS